MIADTPYPQRQSDIRGDLVMRWSNPPSCGLASQTSVGFVADAPLALHARPRRWFAWVCFAGCRRLIGIISTSPENSSPPLGNTFRSP